MEVSEDVQRENDLLEVTRAVSENKDAILKGIDLLTTVHESGALDMINALVKQKDQAIKNVVEQANKPTYASILENFSDLFLLTKDIPVDELGYLIGKVNQGLKEARTAENEESISYVGIIKALKNPEVNRSLTMMLGFLRGMGRE